MELLRDAWENRKNIYRLPQHTQALLLEAFWALFDIIWALQLENRPGLSKIGALNLKETENRTSPWILTPKMFCWKSEYLGISFIAGRNFRSVRNTWFEFS